jgi:hypothetical protein
VWVAGDAAAHDRDVDPAAAAPALFVHAFLHGALPAVATLPVRSDMGSGGAIQ